MICQHEKFKLLFQLKTLEKYDCSGSCKNLGAESYFKCKCYEVFCLDCYNKMYPEDVGKKWRELTKEEIEEIEKEQKEAFQKNYDDKYNTVLPNYEDKDEDFKANLIDDTSVREYLDELSKRRIVDQERQETFNKEEDKIEQLAIEELEMKHCFHDHDVLKFNNSELLVGLCCGKSCYEASNGFYSCYSCFKVYCNKCSTNQNYN